MHRETDLRKHERMKSFMRLVFFIGPLILASRTATATITFSPSSPNVEQTVTLTCGAPYVNVTWNFGDGKTTIAGPSVLHVYFTAGTFSVTAAWATGADKGSITIVERRYIEFSPLSPRVKEQITFYARNFLNNSVIWNFGDGTVLGGSPTAKHTYSKPGVYTGRATDLGGKSIILITKSVYVGPKK